MLKTSTLEAQGGWRPFRVAFSFVTWLGGGKCFFEEGAGSPRGKRAGQVVVSRQWFELWQRAYAERALECVERERMQMAHNLKHPVVFPPR